MSSIRILLDIFILQQICENDHLSATKNLQELQMWNSRSSFFHWKKCADLKRLIFILLFKFVLCHSQYDRFDWLVEANQIKAITLLNPHLRDKGHYGLTKLISVHFFIYLFEY